MFTSSLGTSWNTSASNRIWVNGTAEAYQRRAQLSYWHGGSWFHHLINDVVRNFDIHKTTAYRTVVS